MCLESVTANEYRYIYVKHTFANMRLFRGALRGVLLLLINPCCNAFYEHTIGRYHILEEWPHDPLAFTQGFVVHNNIL